MGARWIDPADYHITLRFVGDVDPHTARAVDAALAEMRPRGPVPVVFEGFDSFGGDRPHALIVRVKLSAELAELQADVERRLRRAGLPVEKRKFVPPCHPGPAEACLPARYGPADRRAMDSFPRSASRPSGFAFSRPAT